MNPSKEAPIGSFILREVVQERIRAAIWDGTLKPGERIVETHWAKKLGISQTPVREALRELEQMGLVETYPRRGSFVTRPSIQSINEMFDLRINLEQFALRRAIVADDGELLTRLRDIADEMKRQRGERSIATLVELDQHFHDELVRASGNRLLHRTWSLLRPVQWTFVTIATSLRYDADRMAAIHLELVDVMATGDMPSIEVAIEAHIRWSERDVLTHFATGGE